MPDELHRLQVEILRRMRELGVGPADARVAPLFARARVLLPDHISAYQTYKMSFAPDIELDARPADAEQADEAESPPLPEASLGDNLRPLLDAYVEYVRHSQWDAYQPAAFDNAPALTSCDEGRRILALGPADRACLAVHAYVRWCAGSYSLGPDGNALKQVSHLLRDKLDLTRAQALTLIMAAARGKLAATGHTPNRVVAAALKRHVESRGLDRALRAAVSELRRSVEQVSADRNADGRKLQVIIDALMTPAERGAPHTVPQFSPKPDDWGRTLLQRLWKLPVDERARMDGLLVLAAKGGDSAKPGKGWIETAATELDRDDRARVGAAILDLIDACELKPDILFTSESENTVRGLIWLAAVAAPAGVAQRLETCAQNCLTYSGGYPSLLLGNAAIRALAMLPGTTGVASLSRLKRRLKRPGEIKTVEKALANLAQASGMSAAELEEIGLPDFGFDRNATLEIAVGPALAVLTITESGALQTRWRGSGGQPLKAPPAAVKQDHARELKAFKAKVKEIDQTLRVQRLRLESLYLCERILSVDLWRQRYLHEPLVAGLARRLIWSFEIGGRWLAALPQDAGLMDAAGMPLAPAPSARVKLWHPMQAEPADVLAWRRRLQSLGLTQPFKQAHREIYVLTEAERGTRVYSNRFAGHVVEQDRFRALCLARGWKCPMFGGWDPGYARPLKRLADRQLQVEFLVEPIEETMDQERWAFHHLSTDQVLFSLPSGEPVALASVDPILFSEMMRDVDLFVGVAGIASDPTWSDRGEAFRGDWRRAAFGALTENGKTRHTVLKDLLPGLMIAQHCRLEERWLIVEGKLRTYRIHLGSGNIQMEPNSENLCIVQDRLKTSSHVYLPFEGDNTLSIILSKAFMLVDDDKIKDASIRSQILRVR